MKRAWEKWDVVQLNENYPTDNLKGAFMIITEPKSWGAQGFVHIPDGKSDFLVLFEGKAFLRPKTKEMDYIGKAVLVPGGEEDNA